MYEDTKVEIKIFIGIFKALGKMPDEKKNKKGYKYLMRFAFGEEDKG